MPQIYIFIVEDEALARSLVDKHFNTTQITYVEMRDAGDRDKVTEALKTTEK